MPNELVEHGAPRQVQVQVLGAAQQFAQKSAPPPPHAQLQINIRGHQGVDEPYAFGAHDIGELVLERDGAAERGAVKVGAALQVTDGDGAAQPSE